MLQNAKELEHHELRARDGKIGHVQDFFFDDRSWTVRYLVVDTGSWLNSRRVLISPVALQRVDQPQKVIHVDLTQEQVRNSPGVDTEQPVSREYEAALTRYYNWPAYWGMVGFPDVGFALPVMPPMVLPTSTGAAASLASNSTNTATLEKGDHHLRSVRAVTGHAIEATDGHLGQVDGFLIDDQSWRIAYLVVDTKPWWPGGQVVIAPMHIREVGWDESKVFLHLTREVVKSCPPYDASRPISLEYATKLSDHYDRRWHQSA